jgi:hypothetical protein
MTVLSNEDWVPAKYHEKTHDRFVVWYLALALDCSVPILEAYHYRCAPLRIQADPGYFRRMSLTNPPSLSTFFSAVLTNRLNWEGGYGYWKYLPTRRIIQVEVAPKRDYMTSCISKKEPGYPPGAFVYSFWIAWKLLISDGELMLMTQNNLHAFLVASEKLYMRTIAQQLEASLWELINWCEQTT